MRKLIFAINVSLDGCCDHAKFTPDDKMMAYFTNLNREADTFLYGRKIYELMFPYWPDVANNPEGSSKEDAEFARSFNDVENVVVFSRSLGASDDEKIKVVNNNLRDQVLKLKTQTGKNILTGGVDLASQLAELDLIDEYHFVLHPIIVGQGVRAFDGIHMQQKLKLIKSASFESGNVVLVYSKNVRMS